MKFKVARTIALVAIFVILGICFIVNSPIGEYCAVGWSDISLLCPVGAILAMISSHTLIPRAIISLVIAAIFIFLLGRAFCGWACPVTLWRRAGEFFQPVKKRAALEEKREEENQQLAQCEIDAAEQSKGAACESCSICGKKRNATLDSRHAVLGGAIITTAIFGFPVFCLICPVGLTFALLAILISLFGAGDLNWTLLFVPVVLIIELVFLRKWCSRICPISALISLVSRFSKTGMPTINNDVCLETSKKIPCSKCATVCTFDVNLRHPDFGEVPLHDCSRCGDCIDACPTKAISLQVFSSKDSK